MQRQLFALTLAAFLLISLSPLSYSWGAASEQQTAENDSQQKKRYEKNMEERLAKLGKKLDELKAKAATAAEQARKEIKEDIAKAEKKRASAAQRFEEMRKESAATWKKIAAELDEAAAEVERTIEQAHEKAKARLKK